KQQEKPVSRFPFEMSKIFYTNAVSKFATRRSVSGGTVLVRYSQLRSAVHSSVHNHFNLERNFYSRSNFKLNRAAALAQ
ncbi:MAG: hypothetical protein ACU0C9_05250, partial [Paracoccaceae bacterium]